MRQFTDAPTMWINGNRIRLKGSTVYKYQYLLDKHLLPVLGDTTLSSLSASKLNSFFKEKLDNGRSDNSALSALYVRHMVIIIDAIIRYASNEGLCEPLLNSVYTPKTQRKDVVVFDYDQHRTLEQYISTTTNNTSIGIMITLHTG